MVWKGTLSSEPVAVKQLMVLMMTPERIDAVEEFKHESSIFVKLRHPNIILLYGISFNEASIYLVMELANSSLADYLIMKRNQTKEHGHLRLMMSVATQTSAALSFLHSKAIAHCDIKGENLLLTASMTAKLADFGASKKLRGDLSRDNNIKGTPAYIAPEIWKGERSINRNGYYRADIYAYGILLNFMITRVEPFADQQCNHYTVMAAVAGKGPPTSLVAFLPACLPCSSLPSLLL
jgi:serine/threonine protein kinase